MFFEYQLDEEIKEVIGIGFHSIERSRLSELQCYGGPGKERGEKSLSWS